MLIDEEMLYLDEAEADRVYQELKAKSNRRREMEQRQNRLSSQMSLDEESLQKLTSINSYSESD
jgi:predicted transposase YdaD